MRRFRTALVLASTASALLLSACPPQADDDDSTRTIEPPPGCDLLALSNVVFDWAVTIEGEEYTEDTIEGLMKKVDVDYFPFAFFGSVTELGPLEGSTRTRLVVTQDPPAEKDPEFVAAVLQIDYLLPAPYSIPVLLGQGLGTELVMDISRGILVHGFRIYQSEDDGGELLFLVEPSNEGMVYTPGPGHPMFTLIETRDRACPNLRTDACASPYNLSLQFRVKPEEIDGPDGPSFELYPTETAPFTFLDGTYEVVNLWSYAYREISQEVNCQASYNWQLDRLSYMVMRTGDAPGDDDDSAE
jgi:hypothetical protein